MINSRGKRTESDDRRFSNPVARESAYHKRSVFERSVGIRRSISREHPFLFRLMR